MKKLRENKIYKIIKAIIRTFIIVFVIGFLIVVCLQRFSNNEVSFFNFRMFTVVSGSMEPKYKIGDVLISKDVNPSKIRVGDTVSYLGNKGDFKNKVITHQVMKIDKDESGKYLFHTQGLTNLLEDPIVEENQLYGVVIYKSILLSLVYKIIQTKIGFYMLIIIPIMYIIGSEMITMLLEKEEKRRQQI